MKVLVIGATGYVGSRVAKSLKEKNHTVYGLARSEASRKTIEEAGFLSISGDLFKPDTLRAAVKQVDAVIHAGIPGDPFNDGAPAFDEDHVAVEAMLSEMKGENKAFIFSTGAMTVADVGVIGVESAQVPESAFADNPPSLVAKRADTENMVLGAAEFGVRSVVVRIPHVYGHGGNFVLPFLIDAADREGAGVYIKEGRNFISLVHVEDLGELYALALEKSPAGRLYQPASFEMSLGDVAARVSERMGFGGQTKSVSFEKATELWGIGPALVIGLNSRLSAHDAINVLGWAPKDTSIDDEIACCCEKAKAQR